MIMTDFEFTTRFVELVRFFNSPEQAISAVKSTLVSNKQRKYRKHICKLIRTYAYIVNSKGNEA